MPQIVIGIVGENGAGKGTLIKMLREEFAGNSEVFSTGRILLQTLALWHIPPTRANMQMLPVVMEQTYGIGALARVMSADIARSQEQIVFYDAVRWPSDVQAVRQFERNILVYVTAEKRLRYERLKSRRQKAGEEHMTWEQFIAEEEAATEVMISVIARKADTVISNNGNEAGLRIQARTLRDTIQAALA